MERSEKHTYTFDQFTSKTYKRIETKNKKNRLKKKVIDSNKHRM